VRAREAKLWSRLVFGQRAHLAQAKPQAGVTSRRRDTSVSARATSGTLSITNVSVTRSPSLSRLLPVSMVSVPWSPCRYNRVTGPIEAASTLRTFSARADTSSTTRLSVTP
jgi:hypothetical protein